MYRRIWLGLAPVLLVPAVTDAQPGAMRDPNLLFRFADDDRDKAVSKDEYREYAGRSPRFTDRPELIDRQFARLDANGNGSLDLEEFARTFPARRPTPRPPRRPADPDTDKPKPRYPDVPSDEGVEITPPEWAAAEVAPLTPSVLDGVLLAEMAASGVEPAPLIGDEEFIRRVFLDLTGNLPSPFQIYQFRADRNPDKRAELIDKLLESDAFARHQARFWRDVMVSRATDDRVFVKIPRDRGLEAWLFGKFRDGAAWSEITRELLTADGDMLLTDPAGSDGASGFLLSHTRDDGPVERTNDTARVFLGINLQCAQCHDHPEDVWKRQEFHEMAAYFGRTGDYFRNRNQGQQRPDFVVGVYPKRFGEYEMPDIDDPDRKTVTQPVFFLTDERPGPGLPDADRRAALAAAVTDPGNYYFHAAFVNRVWNELMGRPFTALVDDIGPLQPKTYPEVLNRFAVHFRASDHDVRSLYRLILNSRAYQREFRLDEGFAGKNPTRLSADGLFASLSSSLGGLNGFSRVPGAATGGPGRRGASLGQVFGDLFQFDPSKPSDEVEATVPQALMLMNGQAINDAIRATGRTALARLLRDFPNDRDVVRQIYLRVLGRRPTAAEVAISLEHVAEGGSRGEAFEDLVWVLINSTEFRLKR